MSITHVTTHNADMWAELCNELWPHHPAYKMMEAFCNGEYEHEYLYQDDGVPVAFISLSIRNDYVEGTSERPVGYIEGIYVKPEFRKRGIAKKLVEFARQWSAENKCSVLASDCLLENEESRSFHNRVGFTEANINVHFTMNLH